MTDFPPTFFALGLRWDVKKALVASRGAGTSLLIILGVLAIAYPLVATIVVDLYVAWVFLIAGVDP